MKKVNKILFKKVLYEILSVSFAVFLGLVLNQCKDDINHRNLAEKSKLNIVQELTKNKKNMDAMLQEHKKALQVVDSILELKGKSSYENISLNINFSLQNSTAWETAKLTQAISYMNIDLVSNIAGVYAYQTYYDAFVKKFAESYIMNKPEEFDKKTFTDIKHNLEAIIPVEENLSGYYKDIVKKCDS